LSVALEFEWVDTSLLEAIKELPRSSRRVIKKVVKATTKRAVKIAKFKTPVDSGEAIISWDESSERGGAVGVFRNTAAHANVLEYGGYPVRKATSGAQAGFRRGGAVLGGLPPGPRTQRAPGGDPEMRDNVSKQAPKGMVRVTLIEIEPQFVFDLNEEIEREWEASAR
jgi:hypothetical protein